jgi:hypothetical protein
MNDKIIKIQQELQVPKSQYNKFGEYYYRSCEDILEALKPLLKKKGLLMTISDSIESVGERNYVKATVKLTDGTKVIETSALAREAVTPKAKTDDSQLTGATSSYARKYALNGLFLIDDIKDSDYTNKGDKKPAQTSTERNSGTPYPITAKQRGYIYSLYKEKHSEEMPEEEKEKIRKLSSKLASELIEKWKGEPKEEPLPENDEVETDEESLNLDSLPF